LPALAELMEAAIAELQRGFLSAALLEPSQDPARLRTMYAHPAFTRRGIGRLILTLCEPTARAECFPRCVASADPWEARNPGKSKEQLSRLLWGSSIPARQKLNFVCAGAACNERSNHCESGDASPEGSSVDSQSALLTLRASGIGHKHLARFRNPSLIPQSRMNNLHGVAFSARRRGR
jgi:hypothetical protein